MLLGITNLYSDLQRRVLTATFPVVDGCCGGPACGYPDPFEPFFAFQQSRGYVFLGAPSEFRFNELCREVEQRDTIIAQHGEAAERLEEDPMIEVFFEAVRVEADKPIRDTLTLTVTVHFDKKLRVCVIDLTALCACNGTDNGLRDLSEQATRADAIRRAIALFDQWLPEQRALWTTHWHEASARFDARPF